MKRRTTTGILTVSTMLIMTVLSYQTVGSTTVGSGTVLYGLTGPGLNKSLVIVDTNTAVSTEIGLVGYGFALEGLAYNEADGYLYGSTGATSDEEASLIKIDPETGAGTRVGFFNDPGAFEVDGLSFDPTTGILYGVNEGILGNNGRLYTIDVSSGQASFVGDMGKDVDEVGIAFDSDGTLYGADAYSNHLYTIDKNDATTTVIGSLGFDRIAGLDFDPDTGELFGVDYITSELITIDKSSGVGTLVDVIRDSVTNQVTSRPVALAFGVISIEPTIDIDPNTLNLKSKGKWVTCYIELPEGYDVRDINASTILLEDSLQPELDPKYGFVKSEDSYIMDHDGDGILERMVKFDRGDVEDLLSPGIYNLKVTGQLFDGTPFEGYSDPIRVIDPP
ncbi:MAG: hypothetical protein JSV09_04915 [Thermoplasmata archaeon]|nr:MAG: hypothetical protein JSV09_04915 [Thermoplasmata archaeon]